MSIFWKITYFSFWYLSLKINNLKLLYYLVDFSHFDIFTFNTTIIGGEDDVDFDLSCILRIDFCMVSKDHRKCHLVDSCFLNKISCKMILAVDLNYICSFFCCYNGCYTWPRLSVLTAEPFTYWDSANTITF